jgi:hypothetical protein
MASICAVAVGYFSGLPFFVTGQDNGRLALQSLQLLRLFL